jgi:hypothetical protein
VKNVEIMLKKINEIDVEVEVEVSKKLSKVDLKLKFSKIYCLVNWLSLLLRLFWLVFCVWWCAGVSVLCLGWC